jgi:hypothetical protein
MYSVSIVWLLVMFILITVAKMQQRVAIKHPTTGMNRRLSLWSPTKETLTDETVRKKALLTRINLFVYLVLFFLFSKNKAEKKSLLDRIIKKKKAETSTINNSNAKQKNQTKPHTSLMSSLSNISNSIIPSADLSKFYYTYDYENGTGELYMRVGVAVFSICAMIDRSLSVIQMIETYVNNHSVIEDCELIFIFSIISKITNLLFIFLQTFFIFKYANIVINFGKNSAVLGMVHIVSTNFCIFIRTIVQETVVEIRHHHHFLSHKLSDAHGKEPIAFDKVAPPLSYLKNNQTNYFNFMKPSEILTKSNITGILKVKQMGCINTASFTSHIAVGIQETLDKIAPYLYPCIIEYSLMCMTVFYVLWSSIEQRYGKSKNGSWGSNSHSQSLENVNERKSFEPYEFRRLSLRNPYLSLNFPNFNFQTENSGRSRHNSRNYHTEHQHQHHKTLDQQQQHVNTFTIDCGKSTSGLFVGIFVLLFTLISLIIYFIYKDEVHNLSVEVSDITELILICLSLLVVVVIVLKLKYHKFSYNAEFEMSYDEFLIMVGLAGIYLYGFFSIIAICDRGIENKIESLSLCIQVLSIVEATAQSILIINGLKMYSKRKSIKKLKPARSMITLLIFTNVSLWLLETFSVRKYEMNIIQLDYYDIVFWSIVSLISSPLAIFFRFHASVCLSDMWKTLY